MSEMSDLSDLSISIHALREEGDTNFSDRIWSDKQFLSTPSARRATVRSAIIAERYFISIHALREEGDLRTGKSIVVAGLFLSTPSARRATWF